MEEVSINPIIEPLSRRPTTAQLYQRNSRTAKKVLGPTTDFPNWGPGKGTEKPRELAFAGQWDLIKELLQYCRNRLLEATNKTLHAPGPRRKEVTPKDTELDLSVSV